MNMRSSYKPCMANKSFESHLYIILCDYVRSFTDTWAHLINVTSATSRKYDNCGDAASSWNSALKVCNPMLTLANALTATDEGKFSIRFSLEVDDKNSITHTAVLMLALDSFLSLVASSNCVSVISNKGEDTFTIKVPYNASGEELLNNSGYPAGLCGPFRRWSLRSRSTNLSGKCGVAGIAGAALMDAQDGLETSGTSTIERMHHIVAAAQELDDSEMGRALNQNTKSGIGSQCNVSSSRLTNQKELARHHDVVKKALQPLPGDEGPQLTGPSVNRKKGDTNAKPSSKKRSRRKGDCSANPVSFVEKFVGTAKMLGLAARAHPPPSEDFVSLFMTGSDADACYQTCQGMRGASGMRSLLNKYGHRNILRGNDMDTGWEWQSPPDRRLVVVASDGSETDIVFEIKCAKSHRYRTVTAMASNTKNWIRTTSKLLDNLKYMNDVLPYMGSPAQLISNNLLMTLAGVFTLRDSIGFRIPDQSKNWLPEEWTTPMSVTGITSFRYEKIIEVIDLFMSRGTFLTSCLNNAYFYKWGVRPSTSSSRTWLHVDLLNLSTLVLMHSNRGNKGSGTFYCPISLSSMPIVITSAGIAIRRSKMELKRNNMHLSSHPMRQSINADIAKLNQNYSDISSALRERGIQKCLPESGKLSLEDVISRLGALRALSETTVVETISNRFRCTAIAHDAATSNTPSCLQPILGSSQEPSSRATYSSPGPSKRNKRRRIISLECDDDDGDDYYTTGQDEFMTRYIDSSSESSSSVSDGEEEPHQYIPSRRGQRSKGHLHREQRRRRNIESARKTAAVAALVLTRHSIENAMAAKTAR
uniref:Wsv045-like protein n=1 Tax=Trachysalambria curvirostris nimavirus TaxID=2984282 RepID=A0A9C7F765_9VIRU|nr:MAG: wsv045-like protein [Trachysalambria curvirostris nimavirus]